MKYLFIPILIITFLVGFGETDALEDVRFDWVLGQPVVVDDATANCTDKAIARFDWVLGQPSVVFDATANCTAAAAGGGSAPRRRPMIFIQ